MNFPSVVEYSGTSRAVLRLVDDFGFQSYDLVAPPRRLLAVDDSIPLLEPNIDVRRVVPLESFAGLLQRLPDGESWLNISSRTIARLFSAYLVAEDPQRRLDVHRAATLMHQVSLVQHLLTNANLRKVLIGDEVGLGKTIEAGLILKLLIEQRPGLRALYLAPARLVGNVVREFREKLDLDARKWVAGSAGDARLDSDRIVVASIHKAVFAENFDTVSNSGPWDVLVVDECHHLSDWDPTGGKPNQGFKLVSQLIKRLPPDGRVLLMSGTPHQGSEARFRNLLRLLSDDGKDYRTAAGRVIHRTKDRVKDWKGKPLFPSREIRQPTVVQLGPVYQQWYFGIGNLYERPSAGSTRARAAGWAKGQALQWAASSVQAGLGFLTRLGIRRLNWNPRTAALTRGLAALRPYRGGAPEEPLEALYERIVKQIGAQEMLGDTLGDSEDLEDDVWRPDASELARLIDEGIALLKTPAANAKWKALKRLVDNAVDEKIVFFAQPVETVTLVAAFLEQQYCQRPAIIVGNQGEEERQSEVATFQSDGGPRFLVSSRAGGEGLNMQRARRLIHLDVPWNPMDLEQRIGRIHRFGSRKTIIVDTIVVAGSREVDMYRIAREKLTLIATHLDPEQFDALFSRVMSLVPPKELEELLGGIPSGPFPSSASAEIGRLVMEGYQAWRNFDENYRGQAEQIRASNPGEATWDDLEQFMLKFGDATPGPDASITAFDYQDEEIVAVDERLHSLILADELFLCGDLGGMPPDSIGGRPVHPIGLNIPEIASQLHRSFVPGLPSGGAYLRRSAEMDFLPSPEGKTGVVALMRQSIRQEQGRATEHTLEIRIYSVRQDGHVKELMALDRARFVRACVKAVRLREPVQQEFAVRLGAIELELTNALRRPSSEEIGAGIRHVVWPVAVIVLV
jgi:superfamily II DNA or RNA helicase